MNGENSTVPSQGIRKPLKLMAVVAGCSAVAIVTGTVSGLIGDTWQPDNLEQSAPQTVVAAQIQRPSPQIQVLPKPAIASPVQTPAAAVAEPVALASQDQSERDTSEPVEADAELIAADTELQEEPAKTVNEADVTEAAEPEEETIFLTIIGDQTFVTRGPASSRPPTDAQLQTQPSAQSIADINSVPAVNPVSANNGTNTPVSNTAPRTPINNNTYQQPVARNNQSPQNPVGSSDQTPDNSLSNGAAAPDGTLEVVDNRPWPTSSCPWTLAPGSDSGTAQFMMQQYGCKYLSTCKIEDGSCTYYYMGG